MYVEVRNPDDINSVSKALYELKKMLKQNQVLSDAKKYDFYLSPSKKRKAKREQARKTRMRDIGKQKWYEKQNPDTIQF